MARRILVSLFMLMFWTPLAGETRPKVGHGTFVSNEVLVGFRESSSHPERMAALDRAGGFRLLQRFQSRRLPGSPLERLYRLELPPGIDVARAIDLLEEIPSVEYAHPNYIHHALGAPNDPLLTEQWGFLNSGAAMSRGPDLPVAGSDAAAAEARDLIQSLGLTPEPIVVAVIDTGVALTHPDLAGNLWINEDEIAGNGIDDDANGYVDDRHGYDFFSNDSNPTDEDGHGTHVAGTIAAVCGNAIGVCGLAPNARVMAARFLGANGGSTADAVQALFYAVDNGAQVLNNSWGGGPFELALFNAIESARDAGVLFVAATGSERNNADIEPVFPAAYDLENVVSVGASTPWRDLADFSDWGLISVDLAAPGEEIVSTIAGAPGSYETWRGTSIAAPVVSAALALAYGLGDELWPDEWAGWSPATRAENLRERLLARSERWPALDGLTATGGHVDMANLLSPDQTPPASVGLSFIAHSSDHTSVVLRTNATGDDGVTGQANYYDLRYAPGATLDFESANPAKGIWTPGPAGEQDTLRVRDLLPGTQYTFGLTVVDKAANASAVSEMLTLTTPEAPGAFADDMESGVGGWTTATWTLSPVAAHSASNAWNDSPAGNYPNNRNAILTSPEIVSSGLPTTVTFWHRYFTEEGFDFGHVEIRRLLGGVWGAWTNQLTVTGNRGDWHPVTFTIPASEAVQVRFRLVSDSTIVADGWMIDDFVALPAAEPSTVVFQDGFVDTSAWVLSGTWGLESGTLSDSPGTDYPLNNRSSARTASGLDLGTSAMVQVSFQVVSFSYEFGWDFLHVQYSFDGTNWRTLQSFTGSLGSSTRTFSANELAGQPIVYFRLVSSTDSQVDATGARIDNFQVRVTQAADLCPLDLIKTEPGVCGCGLPDGGLTCEVNFLNGFESE